MSDARDWTVFDVAVVGLGAHGSAIAAHSARAGLRVVGLDRANPPHTGGSHHGESRIIRQAYYEDARYVPLLIRAYTLWDTLAAETGFDVFRRTGGLMVGPRDGELVPGAIASAREHGLVYERLDAIACEERFPSFALPRDHEAVYEPEAGILFPETSVRAHLAVAAGAGASLLPFHAVQRIDAVGGRIVLRYQSADGRCAELEASQCVCAAGAGLATLGLPLSSAVTIERQVIAHFAPSMRDDAGALARLPVFAFESGDGRFHYGFPDLGHGVKVAEHHGGAKSPTDDLDEVVHAEDIDRLRHFLARCLPSANGALLSSATCRYTNTADSHFILDDRTPNLLVVSACSGHGFKFAPVLGEVVARRLSGLPTQFDLSLFKPSRSEGVT